MKRNLFLDFDGTIVDSVAAYCKTYNEKWENHKEFKRANPNDVYYWDMRDVCPLEQDIEGAFASPNFFKNLEFMDTLTRYYIKELQKAYNIIICTIGSNYNIHYKSKWIADNLPFVKNAIYLVNRCDGNVIMDKSLPNMQGGIIVDDNIKNLETSNAKYKIIFGKEYDFNLDKEDKYWRTLNWEQLYVTLIEMERMKNG